MRIDRVAFEVPGEDELVGEDWRFVLIEYELVVDGYTRWTRQTKRHAKWPVVSWSRLDRRSPHLERHEVPFTPVVAAAAKSHLIEQMERSVTVGSQVR